MVKRRKGPPARSSAVRRNPERAQMVTEPHHPDAASASDPETPTAPAAAGPAEATESLAVDVHTPTVHDALLETVSVDALEAGAGQPSTAAATDEPAAQAEPTATPEGPEEAAAEAEPAPVMQPPEALETHSDSVDRAIPALPVAAAPVSAPAVETALAAVVPTPDAIRHATVTSFDVIGEITEANATVLAFLRNEGSAAVAHWHSLSSARTPAAAIRIQVDEMQRAADASLACFNVLARRAGRLVAGIGRT